MNSWFRRYLLPGFVFQSIIIAGGYGTGRELVEFFLRFGPLGGLLGMLLPSTILVSITAMASFEFVRVFGTYDYRTFFQRLLGRGWFVYEIGYLAAVLLILAVIGSAAGTFLLETFGLPYAAGVVGLLVTVGFLVFKGTDAIERFLSGWSFVLYGVYLVFFAWSIGAFGEAIGAAFASGEAREGWALSGFRYGVLQVSLVPAMLFATRHIRRRREALWAGALTGPIAIIPGVLFLVAMAGQYPGIVDRPVPANYLLELLGSRGFQIAFQVVLFGTLIESGTGVIHAFNERVAGVFAARRAHMPPTLRPAVAVLLLILASLLSRFGIIDLIATGYGALSWAFLFIFVLPLLTIGMYRLYQGEAGNRGGSP
ncbi:MAG: hypothetical protein F4Z72_03970 [Gemmatimonadales bacterium]|nr:hypothetical protein [Candidatus Palauibacter irciniicola]MYC19802.1 hypothetical protein [Gemmatimonadales bacterium]